MVPGRPEALVDCCCFIRPPMATMLPSCTRTTESVSLTVLDASGSWKVPILRTEAVRSEGVEELAEKINEHRAFIEAAGTLDERRARNLMVSA